MQLMMRAGVVLELEADLGLVVPEQVPILAEEDATLVGRDD